MQSHFHAQKVWSCRRLLLPLPLPQPCLSTSELARSVLPGVGERPSTTLLAREGFGPGLGL